MNSTRGAEGRRAVVAGCGPAGAFMAICLARQGWRVEVYEALPEYSKRNLTRVDRLRNYDMSLQGRSIEALRGEGVELGSEHSMKVDSVIMHGSKPGKCTRRPLPNTSVAVSRDNLTKALHEHGLKRYPELISYQFEHKLVGIDFEGKQATFEKDGGGCVNRSYGLFVGADGVWSKAREIMAKKGFVTFKQDFRTKYIKQLYFEKLSDLPGADESWLDTWHLWWGSRSTMLMMGAPAIGGGFRLYIIYGDANTPKGFHYLTNVENEADVEELFRTKFPDIFLDKPVPESVARDLWDQVPNKGGVTTNCSAFHAGDAVVLVGDSAHSVYPSAGQGCNLALESCAVLANLIREHDGDLSKALPAFTAARKPEANAAAAISKLSGLSAWRYFRRELLRTLHRVLPFVFGKAAEDRLSEARSSYVEIQATQRWQNLQLQLLLALGVTTIGILFAKSKNFQRMLSLG